MGKDFSQFFQKIFIFSAKLLVLVKIIIKFAGRCLTFKRFTIMSKINPLFGKERGKYGGSVYYVLKGEQIKREYNPSPSNPRSYAQQAQRALLANMTKFYRRGQSNFFKFAFEDKTKKESDYNAFARNNMQKGCYLTKDLYDNYVCPALGEFQLTKGSIDMSLGLVIAGDYAFFNKRFSTLLSTIGDLSTWLLANEPTLMPGDIFTIVIAEADFIPGNYAMGDTPPTWKTIQFKIDTADLTLLTSLGIEMADDGAGAGFYYMYVELNAIDRASFAALIVSRNTDSGLKVTDSAIVPGPAAAVIIDWNRGEYAKRQTAISWGGNPEAFLQGGNLAVLPNVSTVKLDTLTSNAYAYGLGALKLSAGDLELRAAVVTGQNLRTTAQGGKWEMTFYDAQAFDGEGMEFDPWKLPTRFTIELTATGTSTSISLAGRFDFNGIYMTNSETQGYGLIKYDGIPIWWGAITCVE